MINLHIERIEQGLMPLREQLVKHPLYHKIDRPEHLHRFMEQHVFAVWDFMSLLKYLQQKLSCVEVPWIPASHPATTRMINEIVWGEESDIDREGNPASHFELYLQAMDRAGAATGVIRKFVRLVAQGEGVKQAARMLALSPAVTAFLDFTFQTIDHDRLHEVAAVFTWGREDLIPDMFTSIVKDLNSSHDTQLDDFIYYLERHIVLDGYEHGPLALQMMEMLCGDDQQKWNQCYKVAQKALKSRIALWDSIAREIG
jgi:hypothetical protein